MNGEILRSQILVVDDDPTNVQIVERHLENAGFENFSSTQDPLEALEMVEAGDFDLLLTDLRMPGLNGRELIEKIRAARPDDGPRIIVLSAVGQKAVIEHLLGESGADDFLIKANFTGPELIARASNLLSARLAQRILRQNGRALEDRVQARTLELEAANKKQGQAWRALVVALARTGEYRDSETSDHTTRIGLFAGRIAQKVGWNAERAELIEAAAPLHDLGKVGVPDGILRKPGRLTEPEWVIMRRHTEIGAEILASAPGSATAPLIVMAADIARSHHEKWDGTGYPAGLAGDEIPLAARITAVADVWDALLSSRPYKEPWTIDEATAEIRRLSGSHFDPRVVEAFESCLPELVDIRKKHAGDGRDEERAA